MQIDDWISRAHEHFVTWVAEYTREGEGRRLLDLFRRLKGDQVFDALVCDLQHRLTELDEEQRKLWDALFESIGDDLPLHLALMEPLAQSDGSVLKLVALFPTDLSDPKALAHAFESLKRGDRPFPPGITNTRGWSDERLLEKFTEVKEQLDWQNTTGSARKWWEAFENDNEHRWALVLRLAEELAVRKATITEFFLAYVYSNTDDLHACLFYLDYTRLKKEEEAKKKAALGALGQPPLMPSGDETQSAPATPFPPLDALPPGITNTRDWNDERLVAKLARDKEKLDWANTTGSARKWWEAFENRNKHQWALVLRLAEELAVRRATVTEFFLAYVYSNTDNLQACLFYLDYTRLKKEEESKKKEKVKEENARRRQERREEAQELASRLFSNTATEGGKPVLTEGQKALLREHTPEDLSEEHRTLLEEWCRSAALTPEPVDDNESQQRRAPSPSDSSFELTFIRCPVCRSLVPAVSSRCRMCGSRLHEEDGGG